jgi:magnesium-transporting ATPase (P-type)
MSVIVEAQNDDSVIFVFTKGADQVIYPLLDENYD